MATKIAVFKYQVAQRLDRDEFMMMDPAYAKAVSVLADGAACGLAELLRRFSDDEFVSWAMTVVGGNPSAISKILGVSIDQFHQRWSSP